MKAHTPDTGITTSELPRGEVKLTPHKEAGWFLVEVGRGRYVKRFNLSRGEAEQLGRLLADEFGA
jgi:hypothetical protein